MYNLLKASQEFTLEVIEGLKEDEELEIEGVTVRNEGAWLGHATSYAIELRDPLSDKFRNRIDKVRSSVEVLKALSLLVLACYSKSLYEVRPVNK